MGTMLYGLPPSEITIDDRTLAHLKIVIINKLRRNESFLLSWQCPPEAGYGRMSLWMHPSIPLQFKFGDERPPELNAEWLEALARASMNVDGLRMVPEPVGGNEPVAAPVLITARMP
jgi:hypothetical protein